MPTMLSAATSNRTRSRIVTCFPANPCSVLACTPTSETTNTSLFGAAALWCDHWAGGGPGGGAVDPPLDGWADRGLGGDVVGDHLVHDIAGGGPAGEDRVAVAAGGHEVVLGDRVAGPGAEVDRRSGAGAVGGLADGPGDAAAGGRGDVVGEAQPRHLREAAGHGGHLRDPVLEHGLEFSAAHGQGDHHVAERQHGEDLPAG